MKKDDFKFVGTKFLIGTYKVPAEVIWISTDGVDFAIKTPTYPSVNVKRRKSGIQLYTCFGYEMLYSKIIPYTSLKLVTDVEAVKA